MKLKFAFVALFALVTSICTIPAVSQTSGLGSVKGVCKDPQGQPIVDAQVVWHNEETGRNYNLKTNKKGEYFSLGIEPSHNYTITLSKDGKVLDTQKKFAIQATNGETELNFDLKQEQEQAVQDTAKQHGLTPEQVKQMQEQRANAEKYNTNIKAMNEKLKAATTAQQAGDDDTAIASLNEASQMGPNEDLIWYRLGGAYLESAKKQTDAAEKMKRNTEAYNDLQKAIELKKNAPKTEGQNGAYKQAAELDPARAGQYYFNLGAVLTNASSDPASKKEAVEAFDKAIAADPTRADAYYWKGSNMISLASTDANTGKIIAPDGTAEAFQKYLELQPTGPHADEAKAMLTALNATVETSYGSKKAPPKKK